MLCEENSSKGDAVKMGLPWGELPLFMWGISRAGTSCVRDREVAAPGVATKWQ